MKKIIIVFDAECLLCSGWVRFLLRRDRDDQFMFASIQGETGSALLREAALNVSRLDSLLVVVGGSAYQCSLAILRILHRLGGFWRLAWLAWLIPAPIRDGLYRSIARNRYAIFGRRDSCLMPTDVDAHKFLT